VAEHVEFRPDFKKDAGSQTEAAGETAEVSASAADEAEAEAALNAMEDGAREEYQQITY
jgi:hypothetical protein